MIQTCYVLYYIYKTWVLIIKLNYNIHVSYNNINYYNVDITVIYIIIFSMRFLFLVRFKIIWKFGNLVS